ncbi:hypothetical protein [Methylorubrum aminovorans]
MAETSGAKFLSQAEFARRRGVSRKAVTTWKQKGLLVLDGAGRVDVERTEWNLDQRPTTYRGGVTHRPVRAKDGNNASHAEAAPKPAPKPQLRPAPLDGDGGQEDTFDPDDPNLPTAIAVRRKENWLGVQLGSAEAAFDPASVCKWRNQRRPPGDRTAYGALADLLGRPDLKHWP